MLGYVTTNKPSKWFFLSLCLILFFAGCQPKPDENQKTISPSPTDSPSSVSLSPQPLVSLQEWEIGEGCSVHIYRPNDGRAAPTAYYRSGLVYDQQRQKIVFLGGTVRCDRASYPYQPIPESWEYEDGIWSEVKTENLPKIGVGADSGSAVFSMVYDPSQKLTVMYLEDRRQKPRMWAYDGTNWESTPVAGNVPWGGTYTQPMAYFPPQQSLYSVGVCSQTCDVTYYTGWIFDGTRWIEESNVPRNKDGPLAYTLISPKLAYDEQREVMVLQTLSGWTLEYDGHNWEIVLIPASPNGLRNIGYAFDMAYDSKRQVVVLFGSYNADGIRDNDPLEPSTWEYDGVGWERVDTPDSPSARYGHAMAYDSDRGVVVLFGGADSNTDYGLNDTWEYDGTIWVQR